MPTYLAPGIYVEEKSSGIKPIAGVSTSVAAFIGVAQKGPVGQATLVTNFGEFVKRFGGPMRIIEDLQEIYLYYAVRHFFAHGGTRCYIVRVAGTAAAATTPAATLGALTVSAISPGEWGETLSVEVAPTSQYSLLLAENAANGASTIRIVSNTDVRIGSLLWIVDEATGTAASVHEATGTVASVDVTTREVTFEVDILNNGAVTTFTIPDGERAYSPDLLLDTTVNGAVTITPGTPATVTLASVTKTDGQPLNAGDIVNFITREVTFDVIINRNDGTPTAFTIPDGERAYSPDLLLDTTVNGAVTITPGTPATVTLASVTKTDGQPLNAGDIVNFAIAQSVSAVSNIGEAVVAGQTVMQVGLGTATTTAFQADRSRVYEHGFSLTVTQAPDGAVVETHDNLSLVVTDRINHVAVRLPAAEGRSFYVTASGTSTALVARATATLANGNDGLPSPAAGAGLNALFIGDPVAGTGLNALDRVSDASILCVTHATSIVANAAIAYCDRRANMIFVADPPRSLTTVTNVVNYVNNDLTATTYAAIYFPWIRIVDPVSGRTVSVPPSGAIAGIYARSDGKRGVHKAPAGIDVGRVDVATGTALVLTKADNDTLHGNKVNAIRNFPEGIVVWGARTLSADPEWNYVNVRRLFIFLEQSILGGTQWAAFEPNDESLWKKLRRNLSAFLRIQWLEGKLVGATEEQAFYVKCDAETNPPEIVDAGMVITEIGVAPSKPAEFVVFRIRQIAGGDSGS